MVIKFEVEQLTTIMLCEHEQGNASNNKRFKS